MRLAMLLLLILTFVAGMKTQETIDTHGGRANASGESITNYPEFATLEEAWALIQGQYVDDEAIDPGALIYGATEGMVDALGDTGHSSFLNPAEAQAFRDSLNGEFTGIGVELDFSGERPVVIAPIDDSPAMEAGIRAGDIIVAVDGVPTQGLSASEIGEAIRGDEGTVVQLTIERAGEPEWIVVDIVRAKIKVEPVRWTMLPGDIAFVRLAEFSSGATEKMREALAAANAAGAQGIVLDLRDNPGGLLSDAVGIASEFLPEGSVVYQLQGREGEPTVVTATGGGLATDLPIVVLINEGSASSAEIVAAAIRDNGRGELVGQQTYGTGTVLSTFELSDGSMLLLGTSLWLTANGESVWHVGVAPDVAVALGLEEERSRPRDLENLTEQQLIERGDAQLVTAWELLLGELDAAAEAA